MKKRNFPVRRLGASSRHFPAKSPPGGSGDVADGSRWSRSDAPPEHIPGVTFQADGWPRTTVSPARWSLPEQNVLHRNMTVGRHSLNLVAEELGGE